MTTHDMIILSYSRPIKLFLVPIFGKIFRIGPMVKFLKILTNFETTKRPDRDMDNSVKETFQHVNNT